MQTLQPRIFFPAMFLIMLMTVSCYKKEIEFGDNPENSYTRLAYIDTVAVQLSTVFEDSFTTNGATSLLLGRYKDPYLGIISARPFFQLDYPGTVFDIPSTAVFDSLIFIIPLNHYYYGDTTRAQTIYVNELSQNIVYSYNDKLYNTSDVAIKPVPLGYKTLRISPATNDSIIVRLDNNKGQELFNKLQQQSSEVTQTSEFLNYFNGISLSVGNNDATAVYGLTGSASMLMRVIYHHTTPFSEKKYIDFPMLVNDLSFNQVLADRTGTSLAVSGIKEISSVQTGNHSFSQYGAGLLAKITFPSLREIIKNENIVKLLKAELIVRPAASTFDRYRYKLPDRLFMLTTDETNVAGDVVMDITGTGTEYGYKVVDDIYGENSYYAFNITSYITQMLATAGSEDHGFLLLEEAGVTSMQVNRVVINDANGSAYKSQLLLSVLIINK